MITALPLTPYRPSASRTSAPGCPSRRVRNWSSTSTPPRLEGRLGSPLSLRSDHGRVVWIGLVPVIGGGSRRWRPIGPVRQRRSRRVKSTAASCLHQHVQAVAGLDARRAARRDRLPAAHDHVQQRVARQAELAHRAARRPRRSAPTGYSTTSAPRPPDRPRLGQRPRQRRLARWSRPRRWASGSNVVPCRSVETSTAKKTMLKNSSAAGHAVDHRERGQHHRHRPAQAGPAEHDPLAPPRSRERASRATVAERARDEHEHEREHRALDRHVAELRREHEQPEHEEHRELGDPGEPLVEGGDRALGRDRRASRARAPPGRPRGSPSRAARRPPPKASAAVASDATG